MPEQSKEKGFMTLQGEESHNTVHRRLVSHDPDPYMLKILMFQGAMERHWIIFPLSTNHSVHSENNRLEMGKWIWGEKFGGAKKDSALDHGRGMEMEI